MVERMKVGEHEGHQIVAPAIGTSGPLGARMGLGGSITPGKPSREQKSKSSERPEKAPHAHKQTHTTHPAPWMRVCVCVAGQSQGISLPLVPVAMCGWIHLHKAVSGTLSARGRGRIPRAQRGANRHGSRRG